MTTSDRWPQDRLSEEVTFKLRSEMSTKSGLGEQQMQRSQGGNSGELGGNKQQTSFVDQGKELGFP